MVQEMECIQKWALRMGLALQRIAPPMRWGQKSYCNTTTQSVFLICSCSDMFDYSGFFSFVFQTFSSVYMRDGFHILVASMLRS